MIGKDGIRGVPRIVLGLTVLIVGVILTLDTLDLIVARDYLRYWPLALIALGLVRLVTRDLSQIVVALLWIGVGAWILLYNLDWLGLSPWKFFWPLILVGVGLSLTLGAMLRRTLSADTTSTVTGFALMSGFERANASATFRGGDLTAVMGGCEVDLRNARLAPEGAVIQVFAFWGGIDIKVPADWSVDCRVIPLMGGVEDRSGGAATGAGPVLTVRGSAIMGGVGIKS